MTYPLLFLLAAGLDILLGWGQWPAVLAGHLQDPDSYMRLLRIEQGVRAGHLVVTVAGDQSGAGVMVEWSRLLDMVIWLLAAPLAPFLGWHRALFAAGVALGPLGVGALGAALAWAVEPLALRRHLWAAASAAALLPAFHFIALPGMVHYHIALLALIALTAGCALRAAREDGWYGFLAGVAGGFAIWLTPETMPFVLMAFGGLALRWLRAPNAATLLTAAAGCFDVLGIGLFVDPPAGGYGAAEIDRLSYVYVTMALLLLAAAALLLRIQARGGRWRGWLGLLVMGLALAVWIAAFPGVAAGPAGLLPPAEARAFFGVISELAAPRGLDLIVFLLPGAWAVLYAAARAWEERRPALKDLEGGLLGPRPRAPLAWAYVALCAAVALALGAGYLLFTSLSAIFGAALLPVALSGIAARGGRLAWVKSLAVLALVLLGPYLALWAEPPALASQPVCDLTGIAPLLAPAAGQVVLAVPEAAPELLYRAPVLTVGSLYHHGIAGFMRDRAAWRAPSGPAPPAALTASGAAFVLICPHPGRSALVGDLPPGTLWDVLNEGLVPPWLQAAGQDAAGWRLYRITP